jgi:hypothetical protein
LQAPATLSETVRNCVCHRSLQSVLREDLMHGFRFVDRCGDWNRRDTVPGVGPRAMKELSYTRMRRRPVDASRE